MAEKSSIEWTEATWNPITGCTLVSDGCRHCYAARLAATRLKHHPSRKGLARLNAAGEAKFTGEVRFNEEWLTQPLRWQRPRMIFVCAHGDLFHESVPHEWIDRIFAVMALSYQHTFQVLTKRSARMRAYFARPRLEFALTKAALTLPDPVPVPGRWPHLPLPNVWLGVSAEDQARANERIPDLQATRAAIRFVSAEPLLGPIYFYILQGIDQIIVGGESGANARPMHPDWARAIRDQCRQSGTAFFFKQWGSHIEADQLFERIERSHAFISLDGERWRPARPLDFAAAATLGATLGHEPEHHSDGSTFFRVGKKQAGRLLDGVEHSEMPGPKEVPAL